MNRQWSGGTAVTGPSRSSKNIPSFQVVITTSGAREGFRVDSVAIETHNSAMSRMSRVVILEITVITT